MELNGIVNGFKIPAQRTDQVEVEIDGLEIKIIRADKPIHTLNCGLDFICIYMSEPPKDSRLVKIAKWIDRIFSA